MSPSLATKYRGVALLLLRLGVGLIFVVAGWDKLMDISGPQAFFADLGIPLAGLMAWVVAIVEFVGGLMVLYLIIITYLGSSGLHVIIAVWRACLSAGSSSAQSDK